MPSWKIITVWGVVVLGTSLLLWQVLSTVEWLDLVKFVLGLYFANPT